MAELSRGEKAKQTRINRIGLEAYKAEQAAKGKQGGAKSVGQFKANPELAKEAGRRSKRLPKTVTKTDSGMEFEAPDNMEINPTTSITEEQLDKHINHINRTQH